MPERPDEQTLKRPPVFILGCMKAGTTLPLALLDGHPELLVLPSELNFFRHTDHPSLYPERKIARESEIPRLARSILEDLYFLKILNRERLARLQEQFELRPSDIHDFSAADPKVFEEYMHGVDADLSHADLFQCFFQALLVSTGRDARSLADYHMVEKTPFEEEFAPLLKSWFPTAKFIYMVRNPYATLCALRVVGSKALVKGQRTRYPYQRPFCKMISSSVRIARWAQSFIPDFLIVRYEDLVLEPEPTMKRICEFIGVPFADCLLKPTLLGKPWGGNSMQGDSFSRIEPAATERWKQNISAFEIALVNRKLGHVLRSFAYPELDSPRGLPPYYLQRRESPLTYVANRLLLGEPGEL